MQGWKGGGGLGDPPQCEPGAGLSRRGTLGPGSFHWPLPSPPTGPPGGEGHQGRHLEVKMPNLLSQERGAELMPSSHPLSPYPKQPQ